MSLHGEHICDNCGNQFVGIPAYWDQERLWLCESCHQELKSRAIPVTKWGKQIWVTREFRDDQGLAALDEDGYLISATVPPGHTMVPGSGRIDWWDPVADPPMFATEQEQYAINHGLLIARVTVDCYPTPEAAS